MFSASKTAGPSGYNISRSVRLRSSASAYFSRTPASAGNRQTWTWSAWVKRGTLGATQFLFDATAGTGTRLYFTSGDVLQFDTGGSGVFTTTQVFRDPSAWYHIVFVADTTQATASNRIKLYINGNQVTSFSATSYPAQNTSTDWNNNVSHYLGRNGNASVSYLDGYLTEINNIDGQALTPSSFGSTNATTGVWQPAKYTGTYGTNGFYLNFSDNSAATAAAIGKDYSGNGNNWTPNNISVTAGVTYDSMIDVPTPYADGSTNRGNYAVGNPLNPDGSTWSAGNLNFSLPNSTNNSQSGLAVSTGKWYWEVVYSANPTSMGVQQTGLTTRFTNGVVYASDGSKYVNGTNSSYGATYTTGDILGIALDMDAATVTFYKNNASQGSISLSGTGCTNAVASFSAGGGSTSTGSINFGQRPFSYTPPSGYKALNTYNLPASTVLNGGKYMAATLYTGNGSTQSVTNAGSFKPDLVWYKDRSVARDHSLFDSVRGVNLGLSSNLTNAESSYSGVSAFNSTGFSLGNNINGNASGETYVGWQWQAGQGSTSSNTSGSITSTVSVNATAGFSVVTYTAQASGTATIGHGLGVAPAMIFNKQRGTTGSWATYHQSIGAANVVYLNLTNASAASSATWNNTAPTSSVFSLGSGYAGAGTMVAYCWSEIAGFSKFGSYTGNGSADGAFVYTGHRPRWLMVKRTDTTGDWWVWDSARNTFNVMTYYLAPNRSDAEFTANTIDFLSNGFKFRDSSSGWNASGGTYIFASFAENPFANALAR